MCSTVMQNDTNLGGMETWFNTKLVPSLRLITFIRIIHQKPNRFFFIFFLCFFGLAMFFAMCRYLLVWLNFVIFFYVDWNAFGRLVETLSALHSTHHVTVVFDAETWQQISTLTNFQNITKTMYLWCVFPKTNVVRTGLIENYRHIARLYARYYILVAIQLSILLWCVLHSRDF